MQLIEHLTSMLAPHRCLACGAEGSLLCDPCITSVTEATRRCFKCHSPGLLNPCARCSSLSKISHAYIAATYQDTAKKLVHQLKFERARAAAGPIARCMSSDIVLKYTAICPVPTASKRVRQRGYDQAALIAKQLSILLSTPYASLLRRQGQERQLGQKRQQRLSQLAHAFYPAARNTDPQQRMLLVDDVITTGSTIEAAAQTLFAAGYHYIDVAIFAAA